MATIQDIAQKAGVSPATVSLVLNRKPGVGERTRNAVLQAAEELAYRKGGGSRRAGGPRVLLLKIPRHGRILNRNHRAFIVDYIDGAEEEARRRGARLEVRNLEESSRESLAEALERGGAAGAIVLATELSLEDIGLFESAGLPLVFIDGLHPSAAFDFVDMDNEGAVYAILRALKERGIRRVGLVGAAMETRNFAIREKSFREAAAFYGLDFREQWHFRADSTFARCAEEMARLLLPPEEMPQALFCVCDIIALGTGKALREKGFSLPEDLALVGFDNLPACVSADPPLSSVEVSKREIGRRAFQLLHRRMTASSPPPFEKVLVGSRVVLRESVGSFGGREFLRDREETAQ